MKKKILAFIVSGLVAFSAVGCSPKAENPKPDSPEGSVTSNDTSSTESIEIQFMHSMVEQERVDIIQGFIDEFQSANPNIKVEQVPVDEDSYQTKITTLGGSNALPAIIELEHNFAKVLAKNEFLDYEAISEVINAVGKDNYYEGALEALKTEDGINYTAAPMSGWVQGIWYNKALFAEKNLEAPTTWDNILKAAQTFNDPANKKYGIAMPTGNVGFTEQAFSQFALSNNANVFTSDGGANFNTPEMKEALEFYKNLAQYTLPGSLDVPEVKDAFMSGSVPMAIYSTYILGAVHQAGNSADLGFALPENKDMASFGNITGLSIPSGLDEKQKAAAVEFSKFLLKDEINVKWVHMSPGGMQPVLKTVAESQEYLDNEVLKAYSAISNDITSAFSELKLFGNVDGKNFVSMGDVSAKNVVSECVYNIIVQGQDVDSSIDKAQKDIETIVK